MCQPHRRILLCRTEGGHVRYLGAHGDAVTDPLRALDYRNGDDYPLSEGWTPCLVEYVECVSHLTAERTRVCDVTISPMPMPA